MPDPIVIQYLSGPNMGRRQKFTDAPLTFGRDPDNALVLAEPFVSRKHGALVLDDKGRWALANLSTNGTRINAKLITATDGKPRRLHPGDTIIVGNQPVFTVTFDATGVVPGTSGNEGHSQDESTAPRKLSGRSKVWIGIGAYMLLMLGMFVFLSTLDEDDQADSGGKIASELLYAQIKAEIEHRFPPLQPPNPSAADRHLQDAREWYARRDTDVTAAFRAHDQYKRSLAAASLIAFEQGLDQQRFLEVQDALVAQVESLYRQGYNQLVAGNVENAVETFDDLITIYTDKDSDIYKSAMSLRTHAAGQRRKRR